MADNTQLNIGSGGDIIATDDIAGVKFQRFKLTLGADGANDGDVSSTNPMPVTDSGLNDKATELTLQAVASLLGDQNSVILPMIEGDLTTLNNKFPTGLGQKTKINSLAVVLPSDQTVPVSISSMPTTTVTGTVTVNAGTNTSTAGLALENGGRLDDINTKLTGVALDGADATGVTAPAGAAGIRGWLSGIYSKLSSTLTVTQSLGTAATRWYVQLSDGTNSPAIKAASAVAAAADPALTVSISPNSRVNLNDSDLIVSAVSVANTALTVTLPAAGAGVFHFINAIEIIRVATAAVTGSALLTITTTNLPGSLAWTTGNLIAAGQKINDVLLTLTAPIKSSVANTATTIVCPAAGAGVVFKVNVYYSTAAR